MDVSDGFIQSLDAPLGRSLGFPRKGGQLLLVFHREIQIKVDGRTHFLGERPSQFSCPPSQTSLLFRIEMNQRRSHAPSYITPISYHFEREGYRSAAASAFARAGSCSGKTVRRSISRRSSSMRAITGAPAGVMRRRCSSWLAEWRALAMRSTRVGSDCAGVEPP